MNRIEVHRQLVDKYKQNVNKLAFEFWKLRFTRRLQKFDTQHKVYFSTEIMPWAPEQGSLLRAVRKELMLSCGWLGKRLNVSKQSISNLERNEVTGKIALINMYKIAEAMECELIIGIRPKNKKTFCEALWERILPYVKANLRLLLEVHSKIDPDRAAGRLAYEVYRQSRKQETMRSLGISRKKTGERL